MDPALVLGLKSKYYEVYGLPLKRGELFFRAPNRRETSIYLNLLNMPLPTKEIYLFDICVLKESTVDISDILVGDVISIHDCIVEFLRLGDLAHSIDVLDVKRAELDLADNQFKALILKGFPHISMRDIDSMTNDEFLSLAAMAEMVTGTTIEVSMPKKAVSERNTAQQILDSLPDFLPPEGVSDDTIKRQYVDFDSDNKDLNEI